MLARAQRRLLEGPHRWGSYDVSAGRSGVVHYRLTVYPPGTNAVERRALARARDWPAVGAIGSLLVIVAFGGVIGPAMLMTGVVIVYSLGIAWTRSRTWHLRRDVRVLDAVQVQDGAQRVSRGELALILASIAALRALDDGADRLDGVGYEARWAEIYRSMPPR